MRLIMSHECEQTAAVSKIGDAWLKHTEVAQAEAIPGAILAPKLPMSKNNSRPFALIHSLPALAVLSLMRDRRAMAGAWKMVALTVMLCWVMSSSDAATWYVDNTATLGANNGTNWANAWTNLNSVSGVSPGDTVYISGGPYGSTQTYFNVGSWTPLGGTPTNWVHYQIAQDTNHSGVAVFNGQYGTNLPGSFPSSMQFFIHGGNNYSFSGEFGGRRQIVITNYYAITTTQQAAAFGGYADNATIFEENSSNVSLTYLQVYGEIDFGSAEVFEIGHCLVEPPNNQSCCIQLSGATSPDATTITNSVHDCVLSFPQQYPSVNGGGAVGIQGGWCVAAYSNLFTTYPVSVFSSGKHQDGIQNDGGSNWRIFGNKFLNICNYSVYWSPTSGSCSNIWVYNNVFTETSNWLSVATLQHSNQNQIAMVFGAGDVGGFIYKDVLVANNDVVDFLSSANVVTFGCYAYATYWTNFICANNLIFDSGYSPAPPNVMIFTNAESLASVSSNALIAYNYLEAGTHGNAALNVTQTPAPAGTGNVRFGNYAFQCAGNDLHLATNDTACLNRGMNLSSYFTTAADGTARPASGPWDIGAYQAGNSPHLPLMRIFGVQ